MKRKQRKIGDRVQLVVDEMLHLLGHSSTSSAHVACVRSLQLTKLEERVLMSASPMAMVAEVAAVMADSSPEAVMFDMSASANIFDTSAADSPLKTDAATVDRSAENITTDNAPSVTPALQGVELIVIDWRVQDADTLLSELLNTDRDFRILRLDSDTDGISQITEKLEQIGNVSAIHLLTHGRDGEILMGSTRLNASTLAQHAPELLAWQHSLTADADLLLYGCDVAETVEGRDFVDSLRNLTDADVAASSDVTGSAKFGGDWALEYQTGAVSAAVLTTVSQDSNWQDVLGVLTVTTTADLVDGDTSSVAALLGNAGWDGFVSLREAIIATNNTIGADTIFLTAGTFSFSIAGQGENAAATGDLDILDTLTINGAGAGVSIIDASGLDRALEVRAGTSATISDVTISGGLMQSNDWGGGILIDNGATLNLSQVVVTGNSTGSGAGLYNYGTLIATDTVISNNSASDWGGGLYNDRGNVTLNRVTISGNTAGKDGGGINNAGSGASMSLTNATLSGNTATGSGGGLWTNQGLTATNVTIANNVASSGDGVFGQGGSALVSFKNSLLYNPAGANANHAMISLGNNLDSDGTAGLANPTDINGVNPRLAPTLTDNGGFVPTLRLLSSSPARDAGTSIGVPAVDARNVMRDATPDIGAFEFTPPSLSPTGELLVNSVTANDQVTSAQNRGSQQAVASDAAGNYVVVWSSATQDGSGWGVYARRFDATGTPLTGEVQVNQTTANEQRWARVVSDPAGNFVVTWTSSNQDGTPASVYARRFAGAGTALTAEFRANATNTGSQSDSTIAMNQTTGDFVIVWQGNGPSDINGVFFRRFNADGSAKDATDQLVNPVTFLAENDPAVTMDFTGNFVVAWEANNQIYFQRFNEKAVPQGFGVQVDGFLSADSDPAIASDAAGNFTIVYRQGSGTTGVVGKGYNADGTLKYASFQPATGDAASPSIAMADDGSYLVTYEQSGDGSGLGVFARRYNSSGFPTGAAFQVNDTTTGTQSQSSVAMLDPSNYVVVWSGAGTGDGSGVFAKQFGTANVAPVITSNGGGATAAINVAENSTVVTTVTATDADLPALALTYLITGGADAAKFTINSSTGGLIFLTAPDFEIPTDAGTNNVYDVIVRVSDGTLVDTQAISITVSNVDEPPTANAGGPYTISEGDSLTVVAGPALDPEGLALTYTWDIDGNGIFTDVTGSTATLAWNQLKSLTTPVNDNGIRTVALRVTDVGGNSTVATTTLTINNTAPTVNVTGNATASSGTPYTINLASSDPGADTISTYAINWGDGSTQTVSGTVTSATHSYSLPGGTRSIAVSAIDEDGTFPMNIGPLVVTVLNTTPSIPTLSDLVVPGLTNGAVVSTLSFIDPDFGDSHTWTVSDNRFSVVGSFLKLKSGQQLNPVIEPTVAITVTVTDSSGANNSSSFSLRVNNPPISVADSYAVDGTRQLSISSPSMGVLANDTDIDGNPLTASLVNGPSHAATFGLNANGTFWYRASVGFSGTDTFRYQATDGENVGEVTTVTFTVNQPATLRYTALRSSIPEHQTLTSPLRVGTVSVTDDGIGTNAITLAGPDAALFELDANNNLLLKSGLAIDFSVQTQFEVTVLLDDPAIAGSPDSSRTLIVTVQDLNEPPTATALADVIVLEDSAPGTINTASAFYDADGGPLSYSVRVVAQSPGLIKTISINQSTGVISYSLNANANGTATIRVTAKDPSFATVSSGFELIVQPVSDAPVAQNYSNTVNIDSSLTVSTPGITASVTDVDGNPVTVTLVVGPANGKVVLQANGSFVYTPAKGFQGIDTFRFVASDGLAFSNVGIATINVIPQFIGQSTGTGGSSNGFGSQASTTTTTTTTNSSISTASNSQSSGTSTIVNPGTTNSTSTTATTNTAASSNVVLTSNNLVFGVSASPAETTDHKYDEVYGILPANAPDKIVRFGGATVTTNSTDSNRFTGNELMRRIYGVTERYDYDRVFSQSTTTEELTQLNTQRESLYRQLSERVVEQSDSVAEQLKNSTHFKGRVVGSVGVVTTGFSVGYLFWAIRGGMLVSGLLAQVPAWTMLDPLLVIDGDQKDEDKESLQNLMDRQQAKIKSNEVTTDNPVTSDCKIEA